MTEQGGRKMGGVGSSFDEILIKGGRKGSRW
nr:MAG TPA: hypothetical protein [Caudoviricetes sp.]